MDRRDGDWKLPPKKRNWKPGTHQLGFFLRMPSGDTVVVIHDRCPEALAEAALDLIARRGRTD